jgi:hypothetical protein
MKTVEKWQIISIHKLLATAKLMEQKDNIIAGFVQGRTIESTKALYYNEANEIINFLRAKVNQPVKFDPRDKMRKKVISCCMECGWQKNGKADMPKVYTWVLKYGYMHKPLNDYTLEELPLLVTQAEEMKRTFINSL